MTDKEKNSREIRQGPVFERINNEEDAKRYKHGIQAGKPSVGPSKDPEPEISAPEPGVVEEPVKAEADTQPTPPMPNPKMEVPALDALNQQALHESKEELREVAREVAAEKYKKVETVDTLEAALMNPSLKGVKWGIIGAGQAGGRLAEQFYKFNYPACIINTAKQDMTLVEIPEENKFFMDYALGGAGKDMSIGDRAIVEYQNEVYDLMRKTFGTDVETIICAIGGGGGCTHKDSYIYTTFCGLETIETMYNRVLEQHPRPVFDHSDTEKFFDVSDLDIKTFGKNPKTGQSELDQITEVWRHEIKAGDARTIKLKNKTSITVTNWHPCLTFDRDTLSLEYVNAENIQSGDLLLQGKATQDWPHKEYKKVNGFNVDEDLGWYLGLFAADGGFDGHHRNMNTYIVNTNEAILEKVQSLNKTYWGLRGSRIDRKDAKVSRINASRKSYDLFTSINDYNFSLGSHYKTDQVHIPNVITKSPLSVVHSFVAGYFDGDGCVYQNSEKQNHRIEFATISKRMANQLKCLLDLLGIHSHLLTTTYNDIDKIPEAVRITLKKRETTRWQTCYRVYTTNSFETQKLAQMIEPYIVCDYKKKHLQEVLSKSFTNKRLVPLSFNDLRPLFDSINMPYYKMNGKDIEHNGQPIALNAFIMGKTHLTVKVFQHLLYLMEERCQKILDLKPVAYENIKETLNILRVKAPQVADRLSLTDTSQIKKILNQQVKDVRRSQLLPRVIESGQRFVDEHKEQAQQTLNTIQVLLECCDQLVKVKDNTASDEEHTFYDFTVSNNNNYLAGHNGLTVVHNTGSGSVVNLVKMVARFGLPVVVLYTLPQGSEGSITKANAIRALDKVAHLTTEDMVNALVIVDNSKIEQIYPSVSAGQFWKVANFDIVNTLNIFNTLCRCDTNYDSLDPMDFVRIFSTGNCTIYGKIEVPVEVDENGVVDMYEDELATQVLNNLQGGLLVEGFNLQETVAGGIIITGRDDILDQIPAVNINYMYHQLNNLIGDANIYRGLYRDTSSRNVLTVYTILSGLGLPTQRVEALLREAQQAVDSIEHKAADKSKMVVDSQPKTTSGEQQIYEDMKQRGTAFGRLTQKRGKRRTRG